MPAPTTNTALPEELPVATPPAAENEGGQHLAKPPILAGKPLLPLPQADSSTYPTTTRGAATSTKPVPSRASICGAVTAITSRAIEGGVVSATANTAGAVLGSLPAQNALPAGGATPMPMEMHSSWSPSPKRAAARQPLKPIHAPAAASSTAPTSAPAPSPNPGLTWRLSSGFSHKLRQRLLDAPEVEDRCCGINTNGDLTNSSQAQRITGSEEAAAAAAAVAATVTVSSGAGTGPVDDSIKRKGALRRCMSLTEDPSTSSLCQSSTTHNHSRTNQGGGVESAQSTTASGMRISRSTSWEPFCSTSIEPPRGIKGGPLPHRRPSIPSQSNRAIASSRGSDCEFGGSNIVRGPSPSSKGMMKATLALPMQVPASLGLMSASPTHSSSCCGSDGGLRISPLQRSDSVCSVSDADPEDDAYAASFFLCGSLGSDGGPHPPSPLLCCSPPVIGTLNEITRVCGGKSKNSSGGVRGDRRTRGVDVGGSGAGVQNAKQSSSPLHARGGGRVDSARNTPEQQHQQQADNAETPKLNRRNSHFDMKAARVHQDYTASRRKTR